MINENLVIACYLNYTPSRTFSLEFYYSVSRQIVKETMELDNALKQTGDR